MEWPGSMACNPSLSLAKVESGLPAPPGALPSEDPTRAFGTLKYIHWHLNIPAAPYKEGYQTGSQPGPSHPPAARGQGSEGQGWVHRSASPFAPPLQIFRPKLGQLSMPTSRLPPGDRASFLSFRRRRRPSGSELC